MSTVNFSDAFNKTADDFIAKDNESIYYRVKPENGKNGVYSSLIRFVPWIEDYSKSIVDRWESWLHNPVTGKGMTVVCPSSLGKEHPSELRDLFWKLKNSSNLEEQEKAKTFSRRRQFYMIVQILEDVNQPDLVGKFKIMKFGIKIYDKIQAELKPEYGAPHIPFHPREGKAFNLKCKKVSGFNNFDESKFLTDEQPILKNGTPVTDLNELGAFLSDVSPKLSDFQPKEWTDVEIQHFEDIKAVVLPNIGEAVTVVNTPTDNGVVNETLAKDINTDTTETTEQTNSMESFNFKIE